jgi:hypothetical protein
MVFAMSAMDFLMKPTWESPSVASLSRVVIRLCKNLQNAAATFCIFALQLFVLSWFFRMD